MTEKVYYDSTHKALFRCPECKQEQSENVTAHILSSVEPTITRTCQCGHTYQALLEWKDESESTEVDAPLEMASDEAGMASEPPEEPAFDETSSEKAEIDAPLTLDRVGLSLITCPNCQKEQPDGEECAFCGIVIAKYHSDTKNAVNTGGAIKFKKTSRKQIDKKLLWAGAAGVVLLVSIAVMVGYNLFFRSMSTDEIVAKTERSIALIKHTQGNGSGFLIGENILVTNYHVVSEVHPDEIEIYFPAVSDQVRYLKQVVYFDEFRDLAMLEVQSDEKPLPLSAAGGLKKGEDLIIIGSPGVSNTVLPNSVTRGSLNSERVIDGKRFLQISAAVNPGNSGGPALNFRGQVVAIVTLKASAQEGITFGLPMDEVRPVRDKVLEFGDLEKRKADGLFLANSLYKNLNKLATANLHTLSLYARGMELAEKNQLPPSDGLAIVKRKIDSGSEQMSSQKALEKADDCLAVIRSHPGISRKVKHKLAKLRQLTAEIQEHTKNPTNEPAAFFDLVKQLRKEFYQLTEDLELILIFDV